MTAAGEWNLDPASYDSVIVFGLTLQESVVNVCKSSEPLRLTVISHQIARAGFSAFFLEKGAPYLTEISAYRPTVVVFDFDEKFDPAAFPCVDVVQWKWQPKRFVNRVMIDCQKAINLRNYYKYEGVPRIYFESFVVLGVEDPINEAVLVKVVPCVVGDALRFRTIAQIGLKWFFGSRVSPPLNSIVMIPPCDHPFLVKDARGDRMTVVGVDLREAEVSITRSNFVLVLKTNSFIQRYLKGEIRDPKQPRKRFGEFQPIPLWSAEEAAVNRFFSAKFVSDREHERLKATRELASVFQEDNPGFEQIISEHVDDKDVKKELLQLLCKATVKLDRFELSVDLDKYASFCDFECPASDVQYPDFAKSLVPRSQFSGDALTIPMVVVSRKGRRATMSASQIIESWEKERYEPISGQKSMHVYVFAEKSLTEEACRAFVNQLSHFYSVLGFGKITPFPKGPWVEPTRVSDMRESVHKFLDSNPLLEFLQFPLYLFVFSKSYVENSFPTNCFLSCFDLATVQGPSTSFLKRTCFEIYTRIRQFQSPVLSYPRGKTEIGAQTEIESLFFGFRYAPAFLLERSRERVLGLHVVWDMEKQISVWTDDIGSSLHQYVTEDVDWIRNTIKGARDLLSTVTIEVTLCVIGDGLTENDYTSLQSIDDNIAIITINPHPAVQLGLDFDIKGDVYVPDIWELGGLKEVVYRRPLCSCMVVSARHMAYSLALYRCATPDMDPEKTLRKIAQELSNLSWLCAKPGRELREVIYPPHVALLMKLTRTDVRLFNRFEFLSDLLDNK